MQPPNQISFCIVGSGTAGLVTSIVLRKAFPFAEITNISSSKIGIVGVGEGSTEHWKMFMESCDIGAEELIRNTGATHKHGIRFENWTVANPDYFHSVAGTTPINLWGSVGEYLSYLENNKLITTQTGSVGLIKDMILRDGLHSTTNQFHFDTFMLNDFLTSVCFKRMIKFIDDEVVEVHTDETGHIEYVSLLSGLQVYSDMWIDATGFSRQLMSSLGDKSWKSFSDYLIVNSAIAFPTEMDPSGKIKAYTKAKAASSGWMWEIPTQSRRGNGYVYSSDHVSDDLAVQEARSISGYNFSQPAKAFKFSPGYYQNQWVKNCVSVGLASSFVEPLEATSIGSTIIQAVHIAMSSASYVKGSTNISADYNRKMELMMLNIRDMIRLHYITDREDTQFWRDARDASVPESLKNLLDVWKERPPAHDDIPQSSYLMFHVRHFVHVAQGQNLIPSFPSSLAIDRFAVRGYIEKTADDLRNARHAKELVDHRQALMETVNEH